MLKNKYQAEPVLKMEERILGLSREELLEALKNRKEYKPEAAEIIVRESFRRGLIGSEDDLNSPQFNAAPRRFTIFPCPESEHSRGKIVKSLMRSAMIAGVIPVYYGLLKFSIPKIAEGGILVSVGAIWILMALVIMLKEERKLVFPMFFLLILSSLYAGRIMLAYQHLRWTDIFIPGILFLYLVYCLTYTFVLLKKANPGTPVS